MNAEVDSTRLLPQESDFDTLFAMEGIESSPNLATISASHQVSDNVVAIESWLESISLDLEGRKIDSPMVDTPMIDSAGVLSVLECPQNPIEGGAIDDDLNEKMYNINLVDNAYYLKEAPRKGGRLNSTQRGYRSKFLPAKFEMTRKLTSSELEDEGYHLLDDNKPVYLHAKCGHKDVTLFVAKLWGLKELKDLGVSDLLARLQVLSLAADFQPLLEKLAGNRKKKGTKYNIAFTVECTRKPDSVHPSRLAQHENPRVMEVSSIISILAQQIITSTPGAWTQAHDDAYHGEAWITCGDESNKCVSSIQMNFIAVGQKKARALGSRAQVHDDGGDERRCPSVIFFLSYLPKNYFPGRFSMTSFRLTCTAAPQTCLVIDANYPHGGSGDGPYPETLTPDSPLRYTPPAGYTYPVLPEGTPYNRLYIIPYLRQECARARTRELGPETLAGGLGGFGTEANMMGFRLRHAIRDNTPIQDPTTLLDIANPSAQDYINAFPYLVDGHSTFLPLAMAQKCLDYKTTEHQDWIDHKKAAMYQTVHFPCENTDEYGMSRKRKAEVALRGNGPERCTMMLGKTVANRRKCMAHVKKGVPGAMFCHRHGKDGSFV
ncbi:uncharacterized protein L3040_005916 [Drepanopeziza brunnea f. sp. 'multigermtubi']|uniref:uncharacterized protein n=1 Tax=Drepanopeziza brunnea f. sp. 'multigermtubi' TaxID=698441 RepID=UPI00238326D5|nr:hypothetical protein L3040_005916 [Drepanopeziza brunnea f. sp. 'multigermtubi']